MIMNFREESSRIMKMVTISKKIRTEEVLDTDEEPETVINPEVQVEDEETDEERERPRRAELEVIPLYLSESGRTRLLDATQERLLASQIEDARHLSQIDEDFVHEHGIRPTAGELLLSLIQRFVKNAALFEKLCEYLEIRPTSSLAERARHPALRQAIDGAIDPGLVAALASATGLDPEATHEDLIKISLDSRLIPWEILGEFSQVKSTTGLEKTARSSRFNEWLQENSPK
jgi:hypothetical protein